MWIAACFPMRAEDGTVHAAAAMLVPLPGSDAADVDRGVREERMRLAMEGTGTGFWEWEIATDRIHWSDSLGPLHGLGPGETPAGHAEFLALVHADDRAMLEETIAAAVRAGGDYTREFRDPSRRHRALDGEPRPRAGRRQRPARGGHRADGGRHGAPPPRGRADVPRRGRPRARRLARPGGDAGRDRAARGPAPADWCAVQLAEGTGGYENITVAHVDPDKVRWALRLQERYPPDPDAPTGAPQVIRTGRSELYPEIDERLLRRTRRTRTTSCASSA